MSNYGLAADIGGTKTLLRTFALDNGACVSEVRYDSSAYENFEDLIAAHLQQSPEVATACLAVAGPVKTLPDKQTANVTNLPWKLDTEKLSTGTGIGKITLINDFQAIGYGLGCLHAEEMETLQSGQLDPNGIIGLLGAGTGLGQAVVIPEAPLPKVIGTEGGHTDFAPLDEQQTELWRFLRRRYEHVSYERLLSGQGLENIFDFLCESQTADNELQQALKEGDKAATISRFALEREHPLAKQALQLFARIYGAKAGNIALSLLPRGGVYIAGGIAAKILPVLKSGMFMESFLAKGRMQPILEDIPVFVVLNPHVGLLGAQAVAQTMSEV